MSDLLILILFFGLYFSPVFYQLAIVLKEHKRGNPLPLKRFKRVIKWSILILIAIVSIFLVLNRVNFLDYRSPITYDKVDQITFEDFRGLEFFKKTLYGNERFAYVATTIESEINDDCVYVEALFHPSRSFVYKKHIQSKNLLSHEIYHFKITELFSRKAKKRIADLKSKEKQLVRNILDSVWLEERKFQHQYDFDTFHSYVFSEQKRYERKIDSLLNLYDKYKEPKILCNE